MTMLMGKVRESRSRTEADEFFKDAYPLPVAALAVACLFFGDIAVVVAAISALG